MRQILCYFLFVFLMQQEKIYAELFYHKQCITTEAQF